MTLKEALEKLGVADYEERIFNSNSRGELMHLRDYFVLADHIDDPAWFRRWFEEVVDTANETMDRPETIFQHIGHIFREYLAFKENSNDTQQR